MEENMEIHDGSDKIIFSRDFNIYENELSLKPIYGFTFEFKFQKDSTKKTGLIQIDSDNSIKKITIELINFNNSLGVGTTRKIPVINVDNSDKKVYFSIHVKSLNETTDFLKVSLTFYLR